MNDLFVSVVQFICKLRTGYTNPIEILLVFVLTVLTRISSIVNFINFIVAWLLLFVCIFPFGLSPSCLFLRCQKFKCWSNLRLVLNVLAQISQRTFWSLLWSLFLSLVCVMLFDPSSMSKLSKNKVLTISFFLILSVLTHKKKHFKCFSLL